MTATICHDCHQAIHATFTNRELETTYNTPEALLTHDGLRAMVRFIGKQDPGGRVRVRPSRARGAR